jgi:hypothetical protein
MSQPGYVRQGQRLWADTLQLDNRLAWYPYIIDLDAIVGQLYRGELAYPDFATVAVTHPAFVSKFAGENVVAYAFLAFLGRDALPEERQDFLGLYRMWRSRGAYDPALTQFKYNACTTVADCSAGRDCQGGVCVQVDNYRELYLDPTRCQGTLGQLACTSVVHGVSAILGGTAPITLDQMTRDEWSVVQTPGRVLTQLPYFWEAAVDGVLHRYLGWWHGGFELPGHELPDVRQGLAQLFQKSGGNLRKLEREVLTSALYGMTAVEAPPQQDGKPWHYGPTKQMPAEAWLDSVAKATAVRLGTCDWRFPNTTARWVPPTMLPARGDIQTLDYQHEARVMGGCPDQEAQFRYTDVGVLSAMEQRALTTTICGYAAQHAMLGAGGPDAASLVQGSYREMLTWDPDGALVARVAATLPPVDADVTSNLCQAILRSGRFMFY